MPFTFDQGLTKGLRPLAEQERNSELLVELTNLIPTERRLRRAPTISLVPNAPTATAVWPHPRWVRDGRNVMFCKQGTIYHVNEGTLATETTAAATLTLSTRINTAKSFNVALTGESAWQLRCGQITGDLAYLCDLENDTIQVRNLDGTLVFSFGETGTADGQLDTPWDVKFYNNEYYVLDAGNSRVQVFDADGVYNRKFGTSGTGAGQFEGVPFTMAVNEHGVYVGELITKKLSRFTTAGVYVTRITSAYFLGKIHIVDDTLYTLVVTGSGPTTYGILSLPYAIGSESASNIAIPVVGTWNTADFCLTDEFYYCSYTVSGTTTYYVIPISDPSTLVATSITGASSHPIRAAVSQNTIITIEESTSTMKVWTINPLSWQLAGFTNDIWFATNSRNLLYRLPSNASTAADEETTVRVNALCSHRGMLVLGGISGTLPSIWTTYFDIWRRTYKGDSALGDDLTFDTSYVILSEPGGGADDTPYVSVLSLWEILGTSISGAIDSVIRDDIETGKIMIHRMGTRGGVNTIKSFGNDLVVYSSTGVSRLELTERGIVETILLEQGVPSRTSVGGTHEEHVFVTNNGELYRLRLGQGMEQLYYEEYLSDLVAGSIVISYDPVERYYAISDGLKCYWLTRTGFGCTTAIQALSMIRLSGYRGLGGTTYEPVLGQAARVVTDIFDGGEKGVLEVELVKIATTDTSAGWQVKLYSRLEKNGAWITEGWVTFDDRGVARVKGTGIDFYIEMEADDYSLVDLDRIEVVIRANGKKSLRTILTAAGA